MVNMIDNLLSSKKIIPDNTVLIHKGKINTVASGLAISELNLLRDKRINPRMIT